MECKVAYVAKRLRAVGQEATSYASLAGISIMHARWAQIRVLLEQAGRDAACLPSRVPDVCAANARQRLRIAATGGIAPSADGGAPSRQDRRDLRGSAISRGQAQNGCPGVRIFEDSTGAARWQHAQRGVVRNAVL
jgi:hypothetical protein